MSNKNDSNNSYSISPSFLKKQFEDNKQPINLKSNGTKEREITPESEPFQIRNLNKKSSLKNGKHFRKTQEAINISISPDTWVYNLPFLYNEDSKVKNYEKIYSKLLKLFEIKNDQDDIDNFKNIPLRMLGQKSSNNKDLDMFYNTTDYINLIKKPPKIRTMYDIHLISHYLTKTKLGKSFKDEFCNVDMYGKLITFFSIEIKYKRFIKGEKFFNIGDLPNYFYTILNGKVDVIKPLEIKKSLTGNEYFLYLMKLLKNHDRYTYDLCLENNELNYVIEKGEDKYLPYIYILINISKRKVDLFFKELISSVNIRPHELGLTEKEASNEAFVRKNFDKIKKFFPYKLTSHLIDKYHFITDQHMSKDVVIYKQEIFMSLETNSYFGDTAIDEETTRNATVIASENTEVGYVEMSLYHAHIQQEKIKLIYKRVRFFLENFFFNRLNHNIFERKYFSFFIANNYIKGDVLFTENQKADFVYFIEDGIVELSSSKNIIEMQMLLQIIQNKIKDIENTFSHFQDEGEREFLYNNIKNDCGELIKYCKKKERNKLLILKNNEDIGLISFFYDIPYISDCVVASNTAKIYKIEFKYLNQILGNEQSCIYDLIKRINYKLKLYQERIFNINNIKLSIADKEVTDKNNKKMELLREEQIKTENKNKIKRNDKNKEKENRAEIEKFQDIYINFYSSRINKNNLKNANHGNTNLNNSFLPTINSERNINKNDNNFIFKFFSRNISKLNEKMKKNKSQLNLLLGQNKPEKQIFKLKNFSKFLFKDTTKETTTINNYTTRMNFLQNDTNKKNEKEEIKDKDVFIQFFKKYAVKNRILNTSLFFNKIRIKKKRKEQNKNKNNKNHNNNSLNQSSFKSQIKSKYNKKDVSSISRNQKLPTNNSNDNINTASQKIISKKIQTIITSNISKNVNNKKNDNSLVKEIENTNKENKNQIKANTERKLIEIKINKKIDHPYYSPSVLAKKIKYGLFMNNKKSAKEKQNSISVKSIKSFGFYQFDFEKF